MSASALVDYRDITVQAGEPGHLDQHHAALTAATTREVLASYPAGQVHWWVAGYEDDPRPLWEIPEVAAQIRRCAVATGWTDGFALPYDAMGADLVALLVKCGCFPAGHPYTVRLT